MGHVSFSVFSPDPGLMFGCKARSLTQGGAALNRKYYTSLERFAKDQHSSLFGPFVSYEEKTFFENGFQAKLFWRFYINQASS